MHCSKYHRHIYVDVFAVLVLMPQFIKRPNFLFSVEYYPLLASDVENLKICILAGNHVLGKNEKSLLQNIKYIDDYSNVVDI